MKKDYKKFTNCLRTKLGPKKKITKLGHEAVCFVFRA